MEGRARYVLMTTKQDQLKQLRDRMEQDLSLPLRNEATQLVFGEGNPDAKIYFLGEAPGQSEDKQGRPFVGQAGKLLNSLLERIGMQRADVYISNIVRFRPPNNRPHSAAEMAGLAILLMSFSTSPFTIITSASLPTSSVPRVSCRCRSWAA